jgi:predicted DNA binding CopG/RHH family protein
MRKQYDFSHARANPYAARLKRSVTIRLDQGTIAYFKDLAAETGIPYQTLINSYLRDCAVTRRRPATRWVRPAKGAA